MPLDGVEHAGLLRLLGRLHPLLVHFPVALLLVVPVLEWLGRTRLALREASGVVLTAGMLAAAGSVLAGLALAYADGHEGALLTRHLWGGVGVTLGATIAWLTRGHGRILYRLSLTATIVTLGWAAHEGGSLTHGEDYLTQPLPAAVKRVLGIHEPPAPEIYAENTVFGGTVRPLLEKYCLSCHGADRAKGGYRMDAFAALLAGGKSGKPAIIPHDPDGSELLRRLTLDPLDDKAMPPRKKPHPKSGEIALLRWWIKQGASRDQLLADAHDVPAGVAMLLSQPGGNEPESKEPVYVPRVGDYAALGGEIAQLEKALGIRIIPVSQRPGDGLILRTRGAEKRFGDSELARLAQLAPFIVEAELAGTRVTDAGLVALRPFSHLERLHLEHTALTGATLGELSALPRLTYLNLCATSLTDEGLTALARQTGLQELYVFGSTVTPEGVNRLRASLPHCQIGAIAVPRENAPATVR